MGRDLRAIPAVKTRLPELRAEHGWSQADLAARLGASRETVNVVETGRYDPSLTLAFTIARMFAQPIERIFKADPRPRRNITS